MIRDYNGSAKHVALRDSEQARQARKTDWQEVIRRIERAHGVSLKQMQGPQRYRPIVRARWALIAALRERGWSLMRIGKFLNRDHTTIMYALREIPLLEAKDAARAEKLRQKRLRREAERRAVRDEELARTAGVL